MGHSRQSSVTTFPHVSLFTKGDDSARLSLYVVVSDVRVLGLFVPLRPAVLTGFPQGASISLEAGFGRIVFQCCVHRVSLTVPSTLIPLPPSIRPS